jgi:protein-L-isoaspartate(D-aspartate) O-methyltransferase
MKCSMTLLLVMVGVFLAVFSFMEIDATPDESRFTTLRERLVSEIAADVKATSRRFGGKELAPVVLEAMGRVPRHEFVPPEQRSYAYENRPLPIGHGQTISQPYIVAIMTDLADAALGKTALEVGTGSGYQAAILAACGAQVYSMEIIPELGKQAEERLQRLGYDRVQVRIGDGYYGWSERAPFDIILVTAASSQIPPPLIAQLKPGGKMVIPVGGPFMVQHLMLVEKAEDGQITSRELLPVAFVPLTGGH